MRTGTSIIGLAVAGILALGTGCSHQDQTAAANTQDGIAVAGADKLGAALLQPIAPRAEVADTHAELAPAD